MAFTACDSDDEPGEGGQPGAGNQPLTIKEEIGEGETADLPEGTGVGLFFISADASVTPFSVTIGQESDEPMPDMRDGMSICAYSPLSTNLFTAENYLEPQRFDVEANQSTEAGLQNSDLMLAPLTDVANGRAEVRLRHVMARVTVHITDVTGNYDLNDADLTMSDCNTGVMADIQTATATSIEASSMSPGDGTSQIDIKPYITSHSSYRVSASVILPPGQRDRGDRLVSVKIGEEEFVYKMPDAEEWSSGKEYVYSMRLTNEGLVPYESYVTNWGEGSSDLTGNVETETVYGIGDYLMADGSILKPSQVTDANKADVKAVVFSTEVSEADAAAGYNAYAMDVKVTNYKTWGFTDLVGMSYNEFTDAIADMDGRTKTDDILTSDVYAALVATEGQEGSQYKSSIFECLPRVGTAIPGVTSDWFVPSFGQMIQIMNNLGDAGITADTEIIPEGNGVNYGGSAMFESVGQEAVGKVNARVAALGLSDVLIDGVYITVTECGGNFWNIQVDNANECWKFGRNTGKSGSNRKTLCCVAVKLPK